MTKGYACARGAVRRETFPAGSWPGWSGSIRAATFTKDLTMKQQQINWPQVWRAQHQQAFSAANALPERQVEEIRLHVAALQGKGAPCREAGKSLRHFVFRQVKHAD